MIFVVLLLSLRLKHSGNRLGHVATRVKPQQTKAPLTGEVTGMQLTHKTTDDSTNWNGENGLACFALKPTFKFFCRSATSERRQLLKQISKATSLR